MPVLSGYGGTRQHAFATVDINVYAHVSRPVDLVKEEVASGTTHDDVFLPALAECNTACIFMVRKKTSWCAARSFFNDDIQFVGEIHQETRTHCFQRDDDAIGHALQARIDSVGYSTPDLSMLTIINFDVYAETMRT